MSNDLRTIRQEFADILTNERIIRINQDPMGVQGRMVYSANNVNIFRKPILPTSNGAASQAVAIVYRGTYGTPTKVSFSPNSIGAASNGATSFEVVDVFDNSSLGTYSPDQTITVLVNPTGTHQSSATADCTLYLRTYRRATFETECQSKWPRVQRHTFSCFQQRSNCHSRLWQNWLALGLSIKIGK